MWLTVPASPHRRSCYSSRSSWSSQWRGPTSRGPRQALLKSVDEGCWNMFSGYYDAEYIYSGYICNFIPKHILRFCTFLLAILDFYILQSFELQGWYHYWFHWCQCQELMPMHVLRLVVNCTISETTWMYSACQLDDSHQLGDVECNFKFIWPMRCKTGRTVGISAHLVDPIKD